MAKKRSRRQQPGGPQPGNAGWRPEKGKAPLQVSFSPPSDGSVGSFTSDHSSYPATFVIRIDTPNVLVYHSDGPTTSE
jgi:hypothetical protein